MARRANAPRSRWCTSLSRAAICSPQRVLSSYTAVGIFEGVFRVIGAVGCGLGSRRTVKHVSSRFLAYRVVVGSDKEESARFVFELRSEKTWRHCQDHCPVQYPEEVTTSLSWATIVTHSAVNNR